jgi:hypothetical protein
MSRTINESVIFSQVIQEGSSVATTTIAIKSYTNAIDDITKAYVSFLRALDFMDCQIVGELENQLNELKERRTYEISQAVEEALTKEEEDMNFIHDKEGITMPSSMTDWLTSITTCKGITSHQLTEEI